MLLTTKRLSLRPVTGADHEVFHGILTDPFVRKYLCDDAVLSREQTSQFVADSVRNFAEEGWGLWLITADTGAIAGFAGLRRFFDENRPHLLYALLPQFAGKGFATEAAARIIDYAFAELDFDWIEASCDVPNTASHGVAERLGMSRTSEMQKGSLVYFRLERA